jgi:hypothetical protein
MEWSVSATQPDLANIYPSDLQSGRCCSRVAAHMTHRPVLSVPRLGKRLNDTGHVPALADVMRAHSPG